MKNTLGSLLILSTIGVLSACGGGSGSKSNPTSPPATSVSSSVLSSSLPSSNLSSSILSSSSSSNSTSSSSQVKKSTKISGNIYLKEDDVNQDVDSLELVKVTLSLLDSENKVIATSSPTLITPPIGGGIPFTADIAGNNPQTIVVNVSHDGFSDFARRIEFTPDVNLTVTLKKLKQLIIAPTQVTSVSGRELEGFNVSVNNSNGNEEIVEGDAGGVTDLSVSIPQSALPDGTTNIDVTMKAFNPNDPEDAQSFPGDYQDSAGNKLLSVAFNYTEGTTNTGVSLQKIAQDERDARLAAQKQSGKTISPLQFAKQKSQKSGKALEPVIINRKIPEASCASLSQLGDASSADEGFQIPVYTYNTTNGLWDLLGYGTLFDDVGSLIEADPKKINCSTTTYVLEIEATNEIFLSNWWNLDYPIFFQQPIKLCADLTLQDQGNKPVVGSALYPMDDDELRSFSAKSFVTDANGNVHIEIISLDGGADLTATAYVYNASFYSGYQQIPVKLSTTCNATATPVIVQLDIPEICKVDGRVVSPTGSPLAKHYVVATNFTDDTAIPGFALTDADGRYELSLQCDKKYQVFDVYNYIFDLSGISTDFEANVNGTADLSEASDNGSSAVMKDLVFSAKPIAHVGLLENSVSQISLFVVYEGTDFPLTYNFAVRDGNSKVLKNYSGTVNESDFVLDDNDVGFDYALIKINHDLTDEQIKDIRGYSAVGEIKDSKGVTTQISDKYEEDEEIDE